MNTFGTLFRLTDFGESHGPAIGGVIDGMVPDFTVDMDFIRGALGRRRPGQSRLTTQRREADEVRFLSGIFEGRTTGTPIAFVIENSDQRSADYSEVARAFRPCHADYTYRAKYGHRDYRGGGRASARETAVRVVGGALAQQVLAAKGITITAYTSAIGGVAMSGGVGDYSADAIEANPVRCPDAAAAALMEQEIMAAKKADDTLGGVISCTIKGLPAGVGEPIFGKLQAMLAAAMMSINAAKGFEYGDGFAAATMRGSESVDTFVSDSEGHVSTLTNHSGGIQGGISNGMPVTFRVAFKPIATMPRPLDTIDVDGKATVIEVGGRHDCCVVPRAVPVVEAMAAMTVLDALMLSCATKL
ncbi:MAG: chorismate synthase [Muribaculaceae bacterium]|nr:chorismate synthase [Muribaculaceae bacterium]